MEQREHIIQLSDHVKNRIRSRQLTPLSFSSDELILSDGTDSLVSTTPESFVYKRDSTFVNYQIQQPSQSSRDKRINSKQVQLCFECLRRENLIQTEHQRFLDIQEENRKLSEEFRSIILLNQKYQEENFRLKQNLTKLNIQLREYQINFNLLKQEKNPNPENEQIRRLRHELRVYSQVIANKRNEEQKYINYNYQFGKK